MDAPTLMKSLRLLVARDVGVARSVVLAIRGSNHPASWQRRCSSVSEGSVDRLVHSTSEPTILQFYRDSRIVTTWEDEVISGTQMSSLRKLFLEAGSTVTRIRHLVLRKLEMLFIGIKACEQPGMRYLKSPQKSVFEPHARCLDHS